MSDMRVQSMVNGSYGAGVFRVNLNAWNADNASIVEEALTYTAAHEVTHFMEQQLGETYANFKELVFKSMREVGLDIEREIQKQLQNDDQHHDRAWAESEVIADACARMLENSEFLHRELANNQTLAEKIKGVIDNFVERIRNALRGMQTMFGGDTFEAADALSQNGIEYVNGLQQKWDGMLEELAKEWQQKQKEKEHEKEQKINM